MGNARGATIPLTLFARIDVGVSPRVVGDDAFGSWWQVDGAEVVVGTVEHVVDELLVDELGVSFGGGDGDQVEGHHVVVRRGEQAGLSGEPGQGQVAVGEGADAEDVGDVHDGAGERVVEPGAFAAAMPSRRSGAG